MTPRPTRTRKGKTALTAAVQETICNALLLGADRVSAAGYAGIAYETFRTWMKRGEAGERPFDAFAAAVRQKESEVVVRLQGHIESAIQEKTYPCKASVTVDGICASCGAAYHVERRCRNTIHVPGSWTAAAWKLERRFPQHYSQRARVEVENVPTGEDFVALMSEMARVVIASGVTDEQRELIHAGWTEIARTRGVLPSADTNDVIEDRRERARRAQAMLPGVAP
jgi:hypothetical protein